MSAFNVATHSLLSPEALELRGADADAPSAEFVALNDIAEILLFARYGLVPADVPATLTESQIQIATYAVVVQVNHMRSQDYDIESLRDMQVDEIRRSFRENVSLLSVRAAHIMSQVFEATEDTPSDATYATLKTMR